MTAPSKPVPPGTPPPSPGPSGPTHPTPTGPAQRHADDAIFATVDQLYADLARPHKPKPPSKPPRKPINTKPIRGSISGRGGKGAVERAPRPVMPDTRVPLRFPGAPRAGGDDPPRPTFPPPPPPKS